MDKLSYALGLGIGTQLKQLGADGIALDDFTAAIADMLAGRKSQIAEAEARRLVNDFFQKQEEKKAGTARKDGEDFLAKNGARPEVTTTKSGLQYEILTQGTGRKPQSTDTVKVHYEGTLIDGTVFDSSYKRGEPISFPLNGVIAGWTEGLQLMAEGSKYRLYIPYNLAYGERGAGQQIPPYAALVFTVELLEVQ